MIKLTDLLNEEFTAVSNKSGKTVVFKNKDARDAAVKAGTHEVPEDEKGGKDEPKGDKPNMFSKDAGYDAPDTDKSKESKPKLDNAYDAKDFESIVSSLKGKVSDKDYSEIKDALESLENLQYDLEDIDRDEDNEEWAMQSDAIDVEVEDLKGLIKQALSKDKKSEPKSASGGGLDKDSVNQTKSYLDKELGLDGYTSLTSNGEIKYSITGAVNDILIGKDGNKFSVSIGSPDRLTNKTNKSSEKSFDNEKDAMAYAKKLGQKVKDDSGLYDKSEPKDSSGDTPKVTPRKANKVLVKTVDKFSERLGLTPDKLGKEDYEKKMLTLVHDALEDANFHSANRQIFADLYGKPELAKRPDYSEAPEFGTPERDEWEEKNSIYGKRFDSATSNFDDSDEMVGAITSQASWDGQLTIDAILDKMRRDGSNELADKIQSSFDKDMAKNEGNLKLGDLI